MTPPHPPPYFAGSTVLLIDCNLKPCLGFIRGVAMGGRGGADYKVLPPPRPPPSQKGAQKGRHINTRKP